MERFSAVQAPRSLGGASRAPSEARVKSQFQLKQSTGSSECVSPSWRAV